SSISSHQSSRDGSLRDSSAFIEKSVRVRLTGFLSSTVSLIARLSEKCWKRGANLSFARRGCQEMRTRPSHFGNEGAEGRFPPRSDWGFPLRGSAARASPSSGQV